MLDVLLFELKNWLADLGDVLVEDFSLQDGEEFWEVIHNSLPVAFSDRVAAALGVSSMDKDLSLVETDVEGTDHSIRAHP